MRSILSWPRAGATWSALHPPHTALDVFSLRGMSSAAATMSLKLGSTPHRTLSRAASALQSSQRDASSPSRPTSPHHPIHHLRRGQKSYPPGHNNDRTDGAPPSMSAFRSTHYGDEPRRHSRSRAPPPSRRRDSPHRKTHASSHAGATANHHDPPHASPVMQSVFAPQGIAAAAALHAEAAHDAGASHPSAIPSGWEYDHSVDPVTGKTALDVLYDTHLTRIRAVLEQPLPALPVDGHIQPDFFVGFGHYNYRMRDEYRAVLARALNVPVGAVQLSVAWSGRFCVSHFHRVRHVCGVLLRRHVLHAQALATGVCEADSAAAHTTAERADKESCEPSPLPDAVQRRVARLIKAINAKQEESLLQMHMTQASAPMAEVEFSLHTREHRLLIRLHAWLQDRVLRTSHVVLVYGGSDLLLSQSAQAHTSAAAMHRESVGHGSDPSATAWRERALQRDVESTSQQRKRVERDWLKAFYSRRVVPRMLSLYEVAYALADAVRCGELAEVYVPAHTWSPPFATSSADGAVVHSSDDDEEKRVEEAKNNEMQDDATDTCARARTAAASSTEQPLLPPAMADLMMTGATNAQVDKKTASVSTDASLRTWYDPDIFAALTDSQQAAAVEWLWLVYRALLCVERRTAPVTGTGETWMSRSALPGAGLPVFFVHGGLAGEADQMHYLQRNKHAMDAVLLHPNDVTIKKTLASAVRHGRARLRLYEEAASNYSME